MSQSSILGRFGTIKEFHQRYGFSAAATFVLFKLLNAVIYFECLHIIVLNRQSLKPLNADQKQRFSSQVATLENLTHMRADPRWDIDSEKIEYFRSGDSCVLSLIDGQPAGYTWAHSAGRPELIPGLVISVPREYLYNYAGLTLPEFRGSGLQAYRHHSVLSQSAWHDRQGLLGYVRATNFASQRGQTKSGYQRIGTVWLIGGKGRYVALFSGALRKMGIHRLSNVLPARDCTA